MTCYNSDLGVRMMDDSDVLVPSSKIKQAARLLIDMGWRTDPGISLQVFESKIVPNHHAWGFRLNDVCLDLHWHPVHREFGDIDDGRLWENATYEVVLNRKVQVPEPATQLLLALIHGVRPQLNRKVTWIIDAVKIIQVFSVDDSNRFRELCDRTYFGVFVADCLGYLNDRFGIGVSALLSCSYSFSRLQRTEYQLLLDYRERRFERIIVRALLTTLRSKRKYSYLQLCKFGYRSIKRYCRNLYMSTMERVTQLSLRNNVIHRWQLLWASNWLLPAHPDWSMHCLPSNSKLLFIAKSNAHQYAVSGWAQQEASFLWSNGFQSRIVFSVRCESHCYLCLELDFDSYLVEPRNKATYDIILNHQFVGRWAKRGAVQTTRHSIFIPVMPGKCRMVDLLIRALCASKPKDNRQLFENRRLGMRLRSLAVTELTPWDGNEGICFTREDKAVYYLETGWWSPEENGVWSGEEHCSMFIPIICADFGKSRLKIVISPRSEQRHLNIQVSGAYVANISIQIQDDYVVVPLKASSELYDYIRITFLTQTLLSPYDVNESEDKRPLGFMLHSIQ